MRMRSLARLAFTGVCAGTLVLASSSLTAQDAGPAQRFRGMDSDGDGVITRGEWRGSDQSFRVHDWNDDGVLSGAEVRTESDRSPDDNLAAEQPFAEWTEDGFEQLDRDGDRRLTAQEWPYGADLFSRIDQNRDRVLSEWEFLGLDAEDRSAIDRFDYLDQNRDGVLSLNEWHRNQLSFRRRDVDRDGVITRSEFTPQQGRQSAAYRAGYDRGLVEGRNAGSGDRTRRNRWDLEGQRELEQADSGYTPAAGPRSDYQAGYRAGFRVGYTEGFGRR